MTVLAYALANATQVYDESDVFFLKVDNGIFAKTKSHFSEVITLTTVEIALTIFNRGGKVAMQLEDRLITNFELEVNE